MPILIGFVPMKVVSVEVISPSVGVDSVSFLPVFVSLGDPVRADLARKSCCTVSMLIDILAISSLSLSLFVDSDVVVAEGL